MQTFKYLNDIRHCWRTKEPQVCITCGQPRAIYPFIVDHDEDYDKHFVCEPCLISGRLAERKLCVNRGNARGIFQQLASIRPELSDVERAELAVARTAEVEQRTPRPNYENFFVWPSHCGDYSVFHHKTNADELNKLSSDGDGPAFFASHLHDDAANLSAEAQANCWEDGLEGFLTFHLWRCRHCEEFLLTSTSG